MPIHSKNGPKSRPQDGPKILFFSGGGALTDLSRELVKYTQRSTHIVTSFDSGGSSAVLRNRLGMVAVGDIRARMVALASNRIVADFFAYRFPKESKNTAIQLEDIAKEKLANCAPDSKESLLAYVSICANALGNDFLLAGASLGNLAIAGAYLRYERDMEIALERLHEILAVQGHVIPTHTEFAHLKAKLRDGSVLIGQHRLTGKECKPIESPVMALSTVQDLTGGSAIELLVEDKVVAAIERADLIVFPMGSFYSSVACNLLPTNTSTTIGNANCMKVYVPNTGVDPEQYGMSVADSCERLILWGAGLDAVVISPSHDYYGQGVDRQRITSLGIELLEADLVSPDHKTDPVVLAKVLMKLAMDSMSR